jgi:hypothetical protein
MTAKSLQKSGSTELLEVPGATVSVAPIGAKSFSSRSAVGSGQIDANYDGSPRIESEV